MADVQTNNRQSNKNKAARKQHSTRIDLTPMVDLGFLLITFFIFTTSLLQPTALKLNLPADGPESLTSEEKTISFVLDKNNSVGYYPGVDASRMQFTNYSSFGVRQQIRLMQNKIRSRFGDKSQLYVIIKPTPEASYKNVVDILDEMLINDVKSYVLTDADDKEVYTVNHR